MMKKRILAIALLFCLSLPLFARGAAERRKETTITWWHSNAGEAASAATALVDAFNRTIGKENGITVEAVYQGKASDVLTKVKAIWQSGRREDLPDIVQLDAQAVLDIRENETLIDMETLAGEMGDDLSSIVESARLSQTYKGRMIGMPFNSSTILLYYNKSAFDEAGISAPPRTLDEMALCAKKLLLKDEKGNVIRYGFSGVPTTYELCAWLGQQHGLSPICDQDNGHDGIPTRMLFAENGTMQTFLGKWKALYDTGALENAPGGATSGFASGRTAMKLASTSQLTATIKAVGDKFTLAVAPLPMVDEDATGGVNIGGGALYALDNGSGNRKAIWLFVKFAASREQQLAWHISTGYFPVNTGTYEMEEFRKHAEENPLFSVAIEQMKSSSPALQGIWVPSSYEIYHTFQKGIMEMLTEKKGIEETARSLAREIDAYLTDYRNTRE